MFCLPQSDEKYVAVSISISLLTSEVERLYIFIDGFCFFFFLCNFPAYIFVPFSFGVVKYFVYSACWYSVSYIWSRYVYQTSHWLLKLYAFFPLLEVVIFILILYGQTLQYFSLWLRTVLLTRPSLPRLNSFIFLANIFCFLVHSQLLLFLGLISCTLYFPLLWILFTSLLEYNFNTFRLVLLILKFLNACRFKKRCSLHPAWILYCLGTRC